MRRLLLALLLVVMASGHAHAWWNNDWTTRVKITADAGPNGSAITEPIGRTQILVRLFAGNFDFANTKDDGADLRFIAGDDKTPLHYHVERFSQKEQIALVWVDLADLAPGTATPFYLYWGNPKAVDGGDARGTFDPDQLLVYHFAEENGLAKDTTGFASNAVTAGTRDEAGIVGFGMRLDRTKPLLRIGKSASLAIPEAQAVTISFWMQPDSGVVDAVIYSDRDGDNGLTIGLDKGLVFAQLDGPDGRHRVNAGAALTAGWHHVAFVAGDKLTLFQDGKEAGSAAGKMPAINGQPVLGGGDTAGSQRYAGLLDEFRISKVARTTGAIQASVASEGPDGKMLALDQPEAVSAGGPNYIVIIASSVTPDAWLVIGLLAIMSAITWIVMVGKIRYLNKVSKANKAFQTEYRRLVKETNGNHILALNTIAEMSTSTFRASPLHRLAKIGVRERQERLSNGMLRRGQLLSSQSLAAIRAPMETGLTHEQHRSGSGMVMLTIGISGGPFLGLLGTVVGVMITFAAIAAAGDVNVNAIAPGVAAALLATVAGLVVAIPAMFGYNFLLIRIKTVGADMHAFVEETITRMGEAPAGSEAGAVDEPVAEEPALYQPPSPPSRPARRPVAETPAAAEAITETIERPAGRPPARPPARPAVRPAIDPSGRK